MKKLLLIAALALIGWVGLSAETADAQPYYGYSYGAYGPYRYVPYGYHYGYTAYPLGYNPYYYSYYPYSYTIGWNPYYRFSYVEYPGGYVIGPTSYSPGGGAFFRSPRRR